MKQVASKTKKHKTSLLKAIEKKTDIPQNVIVTFATIVVVFAVMILSYGVSPYKGVHALIFVLLTLPSIILSFVISAVFWLPVQHVFDVLFWPFVMLYWLSLSFTIHVIYNGIKKDSIKKS